MTRPTFHNSNKHELINPQMEIKNNNSEYAINNKYEYKPRNYNGQSRTGYKNKK